MIRFPLAALPALATLAVVAAVGPPQALSANSCGVPYQDGTYLVSTATHLRGLALLGCNATYDVRILADIDLSGTGDFPPFGSQGLPFRGTWDGQGHSITGLQMTAPPAAGFGLIGHSTGATIRNLRVQGTVSDPARDNAGLVVGTATNTTISNVHVSGTVVVNGGGGGIVGAMLGGALSDSSAVVTVTASNTAGGAVGFADSNGTADVAITNVRTEGSVTGDNGLVGGVAGSLGAVSVIRSSSSAAVRGFAAGGVAGQAQGFGGTNTTITDSYSTGSVTASPGSARFIGGVLGATCAASPVALVRTYFTGTLTPGGGATSGGVLGGSTSCLVMVGSLASNTGNLWNSDTAGAAGAGSVTGVARTTAQMKQLGTYTDLGWSMVNGWEPAGSSTWGICPQVNDGYPFLQSSGARTACRAPAEVVVGPALTATVLPSRRRVVSGQQVRIGIRAANTGGSAAQDVSACLRLPSNMALVRAAGSVRSGRTVCFRVGQVAAGTQVTKVATVRAASTRRVARVVAGSARATGVARVAAAPRTMVITPRAVRARVTG